MMAVCLGDYDVESVQFALEHTLDDVSACLSLREASLRCRIMWVHLEVSCDTKDRIIRQISS
jgi:hypothetical protein